MVLFVKRMEQISDDLRRYASLREPPLGWEPPADKGSLALLVERANQWLRNTSDTAAAWEPTTLLAALPKEVREAKGVSAAIAPDRLRNGLFGDELAGDEGRLLQQAVWTRDIAAWARGGAVSDADTAAALFAWVVRNIQLDDATRARSIHFPWQALAYGHGSADHRAWVFVELCRQLRIPAAMLSFAPAADQPAKRTLAAARCDDQWLLYDAEYGLPRIARGTPRRSRPRACV